jgi:hypothetical protein
MYLGSDCCTSTWYNDDGCPTTSALSIIQANISTPGVYIATVEAYSYYGQTARTADRQRSAVAGRPAPAAKRSSASARMNVILARLRRAGLRLVGDTLCAAWIRRAPRAWELS